MTDGIEPLGFNFILRNEECVWHRDTRTFSLDFDVTRRGEAVLVAAAGMAERSA